MPRDFAAIISVCEQPEVDPAVGLQPAVVLGLPGHRVDPPGLDVRPTGRSGGLRQDVFDQLAGERNGLEGANGLAGTQDVRDALRNVGLRRVM